MSKNSNSIIVALITIAFMAFIIINNDENSFEKPMTIEDNVIWIDFKESQMDIWMKNNVDVLGFQFEFDGIKVNNTEGGVLQRDDFEVSHNDRMILSFSYKGTAVTKGEHLLTSVNVEYLNGKENVKMSNMVLAGGEGTSLDFSYYNTFFNSTTFRTN